MRASAAIPRGWLCLLVVVFSVAITGCGTGSRMLRAAAVPDPAGDGPSAIAADPFPAGSDPTADAPPTANSREVVPVLLGADDVDDADRAPVLLAHSDGMLLAQAPPAPAPAERDEYDIEEYDPWEPFNETMFEFNRNLDRYVLKPVATGYDKVVPDDVQRMISNAFDNLGAPKRMVNSLLQRKWDGAMRELARFMVNTTVGAGGLFDMGRAAEIEKSREDFGQTLGFYGAGPGPYLVLPFMEPLTVRDGIGKFVDGFLEPLGYLIPFFWEGLVLRIEEIVNERSLNLELYQGFEETVVDMYSAVRHAYLERRRNLIRE